MRLIRPLLIGLVLAVALVSASSAPAKRKPARVTQTSIGGVGLGLTSDQYARLLHERPFTTRYANGTVRLAFARAELDVLLGASGKGVRITTAASEYRLRGGAGPCGLFTTLARTADPVPYALPGPFGPSALVYRAGRLWFTLRDQRHLGSVTLANGKPDLRALLGAAQCGVGEEPGE